MRTIEFQRFPVKGLWVLAGFLTLFGSVAASGQVVINEMLAINRQALLPDVNDPDYSPAYVELYNTVRHGH